MAQINPYLNFSDNCEEAFTFYHAVFGGEAPQFMRFGDVPGEAEMPSQAGAKIMHVALPISSETILMGSDRPAEMGPVTVGDNVQISIQTESEEETQRIFNGLAAGGQVTMPLQDTFWGATFGMLTDKYGIHWMVNYEKR
jgi:PhnB protein